MPENMKIVLLINPSRKYTRGILRGIAEYARLQGLWTFYRPLEYREAKAEQQLVEALQRLRPDGIFMREPPQARAIIEMGIPTVCFPYSRETIEGVVNVVTEHESVAQIAADHLLSLGLSHFAYCGFDDWWWSRRRRDSFRTRIGQGGFEVEVYASSGAAPERTWDKELPHIMSWLRRLPKPIGVMACNDDRGELVIEACKTEGFKVPDDVAIVGVDNDTLICDLCSPRLSSVAWTLEKAGYEAAETLDRLIRGREKGRPTLWIHPTHVVARPSTDVLAIEDEDVVAALRYIRRCGQFSIGVQQVVERTGLSRRALEQRFRKALGRSIHDEIERVRLELIMQMLAETQKNVGEIARALGFPDAAHVSRFFRKAKGISPMTYRRQCQI